MQPRLHRAPLFHPLLHRSPMLFSCAACPASVQALHGLYAVMKDQALPEVYKAMGWTQFLQCPPVDSARNLLDYGLMTNSYKVCVGFGGVSSQCDHIRGSYHCTGC